jgi:Kef-type K+ transport system membrane component KefB
MSGKDDGSQAVAPVADLSNPRETQSILAVVVVVGFLVLAAVAIGTILYRGGSISDVITVLGQVSYLAGIVVVFYFANKNAKDVAEATAAAAGE